MKKIVKKTLLLSAFALLGTAATSQAGIYFVPKAIKSQLQLMVDDWQNKVLYSDKIEWLDALKEWGFKQIKYKEADTEDRKQWIKHFELKGYSEGHDYEFCSEHIIFYTENDKHAQEKLAVDFGKAYFGVLTEAHLVKSKL